MNDELKLALLRVAEAAAAVIAMRVALEAFESLKWAARAAHRDATTIRAKLRERLELERTWRRERSGVVFEAWYAAREGADDGRD